MDDAKANEHGAMEEMERMHHGDSAHMYMTRRGPRIPQISNARMKIVDKLRAGIEKYRTTTWR